MLWNTVYLDRALATLREQDYPMSGDDAMLLSPFMRAHIGIDGHYSFHLPDLGSTHRPLRDPDTPEEE
ncbi:Tn3 family transposase [Mycobacterium haemophilum]